MGPPPAVGRVAWPKAQLEGEQKGCLLGYRFPAVPKAEQKVCVWGG